MAGKEWNGEFDPLADPGERAHLLSVLDSFRSYRRLGHFNATHVRRQAFYSLPSEHWQLLAKPPFSILESLSKVDDLIDANAEIAEAIFKVGFQAFIAPTLDSEWVASIVDEKYARDEYQIYSIILDHLDVQTTQADMEKARSTVNQFYRDWSAEGAVERAACFEPVLKALETEFSSRMVASSSGYDKASMKVLVPGAGLGRLVFDICRAGFTVQGNEISYHQLTASSMILNHTEKAGQYSLAPFAHIFSNHLNREDHFRAYAIPDVHPGTELGKILEGVRVSAHERMSMTTGDFCVIYNGPDYRGTFDAVATVFFIDTAPNIIRYIEAVRACLKGGGIWINLGPLLWHHASGSKRSSEDNDEQAQKSEKEENFGIDDPGSVELTEEEVIKLVEHFGFQVELHYTNMIETGYISNPTSMLKSTYRPSFWIARKKLTQ